MNSKTFQIKLAGVAIMLALLVSACGGDENTDTTDNNDNKNNQIDSTQNTIFQVGDELFSIPSPVQTAVLIKKSGANYDKELLNDPKKATSYSTKFMRAMNLGIYGADLGYVTMYDQTQDALSYMNSAKKLADDLGVSSAFGKDLLERFQANMGNKDSLLVMVSEAYRASDAYLKNNERDDVGAMILAGGFLEAFHFAAKVAVESNNPEIQRRIGEQKTALENLIKLLQRYNNNEENADLVEQLIELYRLFDEVEVTYTYVEPEVDPENKITVIKSKTSVQISDEQLKSIATKIQSIRNQIVG